MAKWKVEELTKSPPTNNKKGYKKKQVQRDLKEVLNAVLLQDNLTNRSLLLPHVMACMIHFVQSYDQRIPITGVFEVGWLVENNTAYDNKTSRHMPRLQQEFKEGIKKVFYQLFLRPNL